MLLTINHLNGHSLPSPSIERASLPAGSRFLTTHFGATIAAVNQGEKTRLTAITADNSREIAMLPDIAITHATVMGNLLIAGGTEGIHILRRDPETTLYTSLGPALPLPSLRFRLVKEAMPVDSVTTTIDLCDSSTADLVAARLTKSEGKSLRLPPHGTAGGATESMSNAVYGALYSVVRTHITGANRFWQPFFVRYALRLSDGTVTAASPPVLLTPSMTIPLLEVTSATVDTSEMTLSCTTSLNRLNRCRMEATIANNESLRRLSHLKGVVEGVEIAVSDPIDTFIADGSVSGFGPMTTAIAGGLSGQRPGASGPGAGNTEEELKVFDGQYADDSSSVVADHYLPTQSTGNSVWSLPPRTESDLISDLSTRRVFYRVAFIPLEELTDYRSYREPEMERNAMTTLHTLPLLEDSFRPFARYGSPRVLTVFNSRLNVVAGHTIHTLPTEAAIYTSGNDYRASDQNDALLRVKLRKQGRVIETAIPFPSRILPSGELIRWWSYPDSDAFEVQMIYPGEERIRRLHLTPHTGLNCAYFLKLAGEKGETDSEASSQPIEATTGTEPAENILMTSLPGNPFTFPPEQITLLPGRETIDMAPARHSISEGQFGSYPMYLFTADAGIHAMSCNDSGEWSAIRPLTPHCTSGPTVSTPWGVVFMTTSGVMLLSGQRVTRLDTSAEISNPPHILASLPFFEKITESCGFSNFDIGTILPLRQFAGQLRGCYDPASDLLLLYRPGISLYSYVYSFATGNWALLHHPEPITDAIEDTPAIGRMIVAESSGRIMQLAEISDQPALIVRGLTNERTGSEGLKRFGGLRLNGLGNADQARRDGSITIYGSNDSDYWFPVMSVRGERAPAAEGTPWRHYVAAIVTRRESLEF